MLKIKRPSFYAGGVKAVLSSLIHLFRRSGLFRGLFLLLKMNQKSGFDCPGCAWPDPDHRSIAEFCENGVKAFAEEAMTKKADASFFKRHSIVDLYTKTDFWLGEQGRLVQPMFKAADSMYYVPISWDKAYEKVGKTLKRLSCPDKAIFYTSGRTSNEAAFLYQLLVRKFGTNNLPDCSNMCHESSGVGLSETIGIGKGTVRLSDFKKTKLVFILGQNPGTNHPRMLSALEQAVENGAKIISINPLKEAGTVRFKHPQKISGIIGKGTALCDLHIPVKINGDVALLQGVAKAFLQRHTADKKFIEKYTEGFDQYVVGIENAQWDEICSASGIARDQIDEIAEMLAQSEATVFCWAMGLTQHKNAVANIQEVVNLALMTGNLGRSGAGLCPVRGHSNVQGDRTMGIYEKPSEEFLKSLGANFNFTPPSADGFDTIASIEAMAAAEAEVFIAMGGNFVSAAPDTEYVKKALEKTKLAVHVSTKLNRSHLCSANESIILPCLVRSEKDRDQVVSVENSMGIVHSSVGAAAPLSKLLKSEVEIVCAMAKSILDESWDHYSKDYGLIRDEIERVIPGFSDFNEKLKRPGGFELHNAPRDDLKFATLNEKANFTVHQFSQWKLKKGEFLMMTIRSHDQYNTTVYGLDDRYRGIYNGRRVVFVSPEDFKEFSLSQTQKVDLVSCYAGKKRVAHEFTPVEYDIPKGCVATYFPEANCLIPVSEFADKSRTPASKSIIVSINRT